MLLKLIVNSLKNNVFIFRKPYSMREMKTIVEYLTEHKVYSEIRGRKMWMDFANSNVSYFWIVEQNVVTQIEHCSIGIKFGLNLPITATLFLLQGNTIFSRKLKKLNLTTHPNEIGMNPVKWQLHRLAYSS